VRVEEIPRQELVYVKVNASSCACGVLENETMIPFLMVAMVVPCLKRFNTTEPATSPDDEFK
jgi:hypothetical protein